MLDINCRWYVMACFKWIKFGTSSEPHILFYSGRQFWGLLKAKYTMDSRKLYCVFLFLFHAILGLSLKKLHRSLRPLKDLNELIINQPLTLSILYCADDSYLLYFSEKISIPVALWTKNIEANFSSSHFASNLNPFSTKSSTSVYMIRPVFEKQVFGQKVTPMPAYWNAMPNAVLFTCVLMG